MNTHDTSGRDQFPEDQELFSTKEAAVYLGIAARLMNYYVLTTKEIKPDHVVGGTFIFKRTSLDDYLKDQAENMDTIRAAKYLGITLQRLQYYLYTLQPEAERLKPDGYRKERPYFTKATLEPFKGRKPWRRRRTPDEIEKATV